MTYTALKRSLLFLLISTGVACSGDDNNGNNDAALDQGAVVADMGQDASSDQGQDPVDQGVDMSTDQDGAVDMADQGSQDQGIDEPLELIGEWASIYGTESITETTWGFYDQIEHDNELNVAITRNADDGSDFALKYNRLVWTEVSAQGSFYYCTTDFGADTIEELKANPTQADDSAPLDGGCGQFPWTQLVANDLIEIEGDYASDFGEEGVSSQDWDFGYLVATMIMFNNAQNVAITQNPDSDDPDTFPNKYSRIVWIEPDADGSFYYCTTDFGADTVEELMMEPTMVDDSMPDTMGCGNFPWTKLSVKP